MLIPNKFNGYQADGCRLLPVGGGVGEAALIGAAMGGGSAALTGGDPLKGALLGGLTGGAGAGLSSGIAALNPAATATLPAAAAAPAAGAGAAGATTAATLPAAAAPTVATTAAAAPTAGAGITTLEAANIAANPGLYPAGSTLPNMATTFMPNGQALATYAPGSNAVAGAAGGVQPTAADVIKEALSSAERASKEDTFTQGMQRFLQDPISSIKRNPFPAGAGALSGAVGAREEDEMPSNEYDGPLKRFRYSPDVYRPQFAEGGIASLTSMPVERMSDRNDTMAMMASKGQMYAQGGISSLGSYSDGGRMLKGPGDGMSDSIPASIAGKRPARLATEEFVVPADVVSHLGNGSSDAGAKQLYAMMDRVRSARTGTKKQGRQIRPQSMMPA
jgi:hypothetical protein